MVSTLFAFMLFLLGCRAETARQSADSPSIGSASGRPSGSTAGIKASLPSTPVVPASAAPASEPVIDCFGDSLTAGYNIDPGGSYPDDLQALLDSRGYRYRVVNSGISGETTKDGLNRIGRVIARHPELVVVEFGGNDGLRGVPVEESQRNLTEIVSRLRNSGTKVALAGITLPPQFGADYIHQFNAMYPAVARRFQVPLLPFLLQDVYGVPGSIQQDGIHPTAQGAKQVAINVEKLIAPMLHK